MLAEQRGYIEFRQKGESPRRVPIGGVGFVFDGRPDQDGLVYAGIDFDHAISTEGNITSLAEERIRRIGSYFEISVSGRGLHGIVKAKPLAGGIAHNGVEMYTAGRYFTVTGSTAGAGAIVSAAREFEALAQELRDVKSGDAKGAGVKNFGNFPPRPTSPATNELGSGIEAGWFEKLPPAKRSEAVRYAALHIAAHTSSFELTQHGGNHQDYVRLVFAIARSGVADAEDIFVEAASTAKDADSEQQLRNWFKDCESAQSRPNIVTVGTLFHMAGQCGADFTPWKVIANTPGVHQQSVASTINPPDDAADVAVYAPGNAEQCRRLLDKAVAADARTFTLGDPAGPLVVLRVPDEDAVPPAARWEGDLPGATLATPADIMQRAERLIWQVPKGAKLVRSHPPRQFVADYLVQMRGQYGALPLRGIARVPHIDDQGEIRFTSGYDGQTGLFHDGSSVFDVPTNLRSGGG